MRTYSPRRHALTAIALVASLALAGCGGDDEPGADGPEGQKIADGVKLMGQWPLTGLPSKEEAPKHPVTVVKIDNSSSSAPQIGLGGSDLIVEELVEGGATRLAVFYYSELPKTVGPVRSMRATDIGIIEPAEAVLVASGGAPPTVKRVGDAGIKAFTEGATGYFRDTARTSPYNLFMRLPELADTLSSDGAPPNYLPWGDEADFPKGQPASGLSAVFSGGHTTNWEYQDGSYANLNTHAAEGDQFTPDTVLVLRVEVGDAGYLDPAGNPVPETKFTGTGEAMVFHGGRLVRGTWKKDGFDGALALETQAGKLTVPPGRTWIELVPADGGNVTVTP